MNANKPAAGSDSIEPDDALELTEEFFDRADEYVGEKLVRRGRPNAETAIDASLADVPASTEEKTERKRKVMRVAKELKPRE